MQILGDVATHAGERLALDYREAKAAHSKDNEQQREAQQHPGLLLRHDGREDVLRDEGGDQRQQPDHQAEQDDPPEVPTHGGAEVCEDPPPTHLVPRKWPIEHRRLVVQASGNGGVHPAPGAVGRIHRSIAVVTNAAVRRGLDPRSYLDRTLNRAAQRLFGNIHGPERAGSND